MALLGSDVTQDLLNVKPEDFSPIPEGEYILQITKTEQKQTKTGTGMYISVTFDVIGPSYQGRKLFCRFNYRNDNSIAEKIGRQQIKALQLACDIPGALTDDQQFIGHIVKASVTIRPGGDGYGPQNEAKNFKPVGDAMPSSPMGMPPVAGAAPAGDAIMPPQGGGFSQAFAQPQAQPPQPQTPPAAPSANNAKWW